MVRRATLLLGILLLIASPVGKDGADARSALRAPENSTQGPEVSLRAASGAEVVYKDVAESSDEDTNEPLTSRDIPWLVLRRNGDLTRPAERTLIVEVSNVVVPPPGVTVTLQVETQLRAPDPGAGHVQRLQTDDGSTRITVWRETRWIPNASPNPIVAARQVLTRTFGAFVAAKEAGLARPSVQEAPVVANPPGALTTPTDYHRYALSVTPGREDTTAPQRDASVHAEPATLTQDHAFLMENQVIARLPSVTELHPGAAPDEMVVYYTDMAPFQRDARDPTTRLRRDEVPNYVRTELVPRMTEAFHVQTDDWGFPWHEAWTSYRPGPNEERLTVALSDGRTWYHGPVPGRGHAGISTRVSGGGLAAYDTLTEGVLSSFHHELFHNQQRSINQHFGGDGNVDGAENAWRFFSEGTAVMASTVGQFDAELGGLSTSYLSRANGFVGYGILGRGDLSSSYEAMNPYRSAPYWRFLYEQCGRTEAGTLDPAQGMQVIRRALSILYEGDVVDIRESTDLVGTLPMIMDRALAESPCRFDSYEESLTGFARALYLLRVGDGTKASSAPAAQWRLADPYRSYAHPPVTTVDYENAGLRHAGGIASSFGISFVEVLLDPAAKDQPLAVEVQRASGSSAEFTAEIWQLTYDTPMPTPHHRATAGTQVVAAEADDDGTLLLQATDAVDVGEHGGLGVIITRVDSHEDIDPVGAYTLRVQPAGAAAAQNGPEGS